MPRIILVQHGITEQLKQWQLHSDTAIPLNKRGGKQAIFIAGISSSIKVNHNAYLYAENRS